MLTYSKGSTNTVAERIIERTGQIALTRRWGSEIVHELSDTGKEVGLELTFLAFTRRLAFRPRKRC
jgi:hypothetical protein